MTNSKNWISAGLMLALIGMVIGSLYFPVSTATHPVAWENEQTQPTFTSQVIQNGAYGQDVYELQGRLAFLGYYKGQLTSHFDAATKRAVADFQAKFGMKVDGVAGGSTKLRLYDATKNWKPTASSYNPNPDQNSSGTSAASSSNSKSSSSSGGNNDGMSMGTSNPMGLTANDLKIMANAVNGESRGEPFEGQVAVAAVILNRVKSSQFPNTVSGVIFQPCAFTAVADGQIWLEPSDSCKKAVQEALNGWDPTNGCLYYFNPKTATSKWIWSRPQVKTIGQHIFCM